MRLTANDTHWTTEAVERYPSGNQSLDSKFIMYMHIIYYYNKILYIYDLSIIYHDLSSFKLPYITVYVLN